MQGSMRQVLLPYQLNPLEMSFMELTCLNTILIRVPSSLQRLHRRSIKKPPSFCDRVHHNRDQRLSKDMKLQSLNFGHSFQRSLVFLFLTALSFNGLESVTSMSSRNQLNPSSSQSKSLSMKGLRYRKCTTTAKSERVCKKVVQCGVPSRQNGIRFTRGK